MIQINAPSTATADVVEVVRQFNQALAQVAALIGPAVVKVADLPGVKKIEAGGARLAFVPDEAGGATLAFWDGASWRRTSDNAVCS